MTIERLSPMEGAILDLLARGDSPKACRKKMSVKLSTIYSHIRNAKRKAGLESGASLQRLILWYQQEAGWLRMPDEENGGGS